MSETTAAPDFVIQNWLLVVEKAKKSLTRSQYEDWRFIVGLDGSPAKRAEIGEAALRQFFQTNTGATGGYLISGKNLSDEELARIRKAIQDYFAGGETG